MTLGQLELLVEPFKENDPGPHVSAAVDALRQAGLEPTMGPFATTADGDLTTLIEAVSALLTSGFEAGATTIQLQISVVAE